MKKSPTFSALRKKADSVFSLLVRSRCRWTCERCGSVYPEGSQGFHCSHVFSRRANAIRFHPWNAMGLCFPCHNWYGGNPTVSGEWARQVLGSPRHSYLESVFRDHTQKFSGRDLADILANLKASWKAMQMERDAGVTGRLEFLSPYPMVMA